jgi:eukaryotic-like serine/threonine-protein kinase
MITVIRVCRKCGAKIYSDAPEGLCTRCVLETALWTFPEETVVPTRWDDPGRLDTGQRLFGRYTLIRILGRGGMGIVWLAHDEELERNVALKFLPDLLIHDAAVLSDLKRETRRCLELTHKNIVRIYDFVHDERLGCISMEYIDGDTLSKLRCDKERKVFEAAELTDWMSQLCDALDYAHNYAHIIHRDLKPANLMVNQRGQLKVSDFGIARSVGDSMSVITMAGGRSGTLSYMSPQQLEGARGTHLDDIYSLGASIYELLTSKPPFYVGNIDRQIREKVPPPMTARRKEFEIEAEPIPAGWEEWVAACLAKNPGCRPQAVTEIARQLQMPSLEARQRATRSFIPRSKKRVLALVVALLCLLTLAIGGWYFGIFKPAHAKIGAVAGVSTPNPEKSIAVLPFENLSNDPENAYFADGIQEEILMRLSKIADLKVISRTSTRRFKSAPEDLRQIAQQLGVANVLEGSVQKAADQVRVNVQLINAATDTHLWADTYDRKLTDIFAVESEIAKTVADRLQAKLTGAEQRAIASRPTENSEAHQLYLRGRFYWNKVLGPEFDKSRQYYQQAIELDPNYALAYAGLADFYGFALGYGLLPPEEKLAKMAEDMANKALELDPTLGEAYNALASAKLYYHRDWPAAERDFRRGFELSPKFAEMHAHYAVCLIIFGRKQEAFAEMQRALDLDPLSPRFGFWLGWLYFLARQYDAALEQFRKTLELDPNLPILHEYLGDTYEKKQMQKEAIAEWSKGLRLIGTGEDASLLERTYTESGFDAALRALAQKRLETFKEKTGRGEYVPAREYVVAYMRLGDKEQAFAWLAKACAERNGFSLRIGVSPVLDPLRNDPRFQKLANAQP